MKRNRTRTNSGGGGTLEGMTNSFISRKHLTPCRRLGLTPPRLLNKQKQQQETTKQPKLPVTPVIVPPQPEPEPEPQLELEPELFCTPPQSTTPTISVTPTLPITTPLSLTPTPLETIKPPSRNLSRASSTLSTKHESSDEEPLAKLKPKPKQDRAKKLHKQKSNDKSGSSITLSQKTVSSSLLSDSDDDFNIKPPIKKKPVVTANGSSRTNSALLKQIEDIKERIDRKRKEVDKLKIGDSSGDAALKASILQWRTACREALENLAEVNRKKRSDKVNMEDLLKLLNIPCELVNYDPKLMCFV